MKVLLVLCVIYAAVFFLGWGGVFAFGKEPTTLEEATTRKHSDRNVSVFVDKERGYVCYYRKTADGISCVPHRG